MRTLWRMSLNGHNKRQILVQDQDADDPPSREFADVTRNRNQEAPDVALTQAQLSKVKKELDRRYGALLEEVRDELEASENQQIVELMGRTPADSADASFADALADLNVDLIDRHVHEIRDIEAARQRIDKKSFGICIDCEADVGYERLMAYPTAKRCMPCQQQREKTYGHQATPKL